MINYIFVFLSSKQNEMRPISFLLLGLLLFFAACKNPNADKVDVTVNADTVKTDNMTDMKDKDDGKFAEVDSATMMKAWMDFRTPGDMHKWMGKQEGTWTGEVSMWMDPDAPPMTSTATIKNKMALNGLYQMGDYTSTMMGEPFNGHSILAYDNARKEFINTWVDNMGSGIVVMRGTWNDGSKTLSLKGSQTDPVTGKDSDLREELKFVDDNTQVMTMYGAGMDGKEMKFMEGTFKRKM